jgi:hypothetical protein
VFFCPEINYWIVTRRAEDAPLDMIRTIAFRGPRALWVDLKEART